MGDEAAAAIVNVYGNIGSLAEFKVGEDWELYQERLEQYFIANAVADNRKVSVLLTVIGPEAYKTLRNLCDPTLPKDKTLEQLCEQLKKQYSPRVSVFKERVEFYDQKQRPQETVNQWYARIKNKAINCKFGNQLSEKLKDKFVTGLQRGPVLDRVCEEELTSTLDHVLEVALKKEAALSTATTVPYNKIDT